MAWQKDLNSVDHFYVHLISAKDSDRGFGNNSPAHFTNVLPAPLNFDTTEKIWEVAIEDIQLPNSLYNITSKDLVINYHNTRLFPNYHIFPDLERQNHHVLRKIVLTPGFYDPAQLADHLNSQFEKFIEFAIKERETIIHDALDAQILLAGREETLKERDSMPETANKVRINGQLLQLEMVIDEFISQRRNGNLGKVFDQEKQRYGRFNALSRSRTLYIKERNKRKNKKKIDKHGFETSESHYRRRFLSAMNQQEERLIRADRINPEWAFVKRSHFPSFATTTTTTTTTTSSNSNSATSTTSTTTTTTTTTTASSSSSSRTTADLSLTTPDTPPPTTWYDWETALRRREHSSTVFVPHTLHREDFGLKFHFEPETKKFRIDLLDHDEEIYFEEESSGKLKSLLGIDPLKKRFQEPGYLSERTVNLNSHLQRVFVYCNLVNFSFIGSQSAPILRIIDLTDELETTYESINKDNVSHSPIFLHPSFDRPQYYAVNGTTFKEITVSLHNEFGDVLEFQPTKEDTIITLHFKTKGS